MPRKVALLFAISIINALYLCRLNIFAKHLSFILLTSIIFKCTILTMKENNYEKGVVYADSLILPT